MPGGIRSGIKRRGRSLSTKIRAEIPFAGSCRKNGRDCSSVAGFLPNVQRRSLRLVLRPCLTSLPRIGERHRLSRQPLGDVILYERNTLQTKMTHAANIRSPPIRTFPPSESYLSVKQDRSTPIPPRLPLNQTLSPGRTTPGPRTSVRQCSHSPSTCANPIS
mgnify:CR=1 FL=1